MALIVNTADWPYESSWWLTTWKRTQTKLRHLWLHVHWLFPTDCFLWWKGTWSEWLCLHREARFRDCFLANKAPVLKSITVIPKLRGKWEWSYIRRTFERGGEIGEAWSVWRGWSWCLSDAPEKPTKRLRPKNQRSASHTCLSTFTGSTSVKMLFLTCRNGENEA